MAKSPPLQKLEELLFQEWEKNWDEHPKNNNVDWKEDVVVEEIKKYNAFPIKNGIAWLGWKSISLLKVALIGYLLEPLCEWLFGPPQYKEIEKKRNWLTRNDLQKIGLNKNTKIFETIESFNILFWLIVKTSLTNHPRLQLWSNNWQKLIDNIGKALALLIKECAFNRIIKPPDMDQASFLFKQINPSAEKIDERNLSAATSTNLTVKSLNLKFQALDIRPTEIRSFVDEALSSPTDSRQDFEKAVEYPLLPNQLPKLR